MKKIMVGLSGGVDSAVALYLLKKQGYDVVAGFMRNWDSFANGDVLGNPTIEDDVCPQEKDYMDAKKVADQLGVKLYRVDFVKEYWDSVFTYFLKEYERGRTPNPDVFCNKYIKFDAFLKFAKEMGCDGIATGHYAKRVEGEDGMTLLCKCHDQSKDQTYFLSQLTQEQIASCLFPLGDIDKVEVRQIAKSLGLEVATKKDSTGVCFIGERNFKEFLKNYIPAKSGDIVDYHSKEKVGRHDGVMYYTIGQRKGLGIGGLKNHQNGSWFVVKKDVKNNILYVVQGDEDEELLSDECWIQNVVFSSRRPEEGKVLGCKFRYRQKDCPVTITYEEDGQICIHYCSPVRAVTEGQIAVLYDGDICLGGGIIERVFYQGKRK